ncbi:hypothetical protein [Pseudomonas sp. RIT-PI-AD]|uniref:hypothetical protein n=1 Tax=Pseudomonas sp. RIT-PI-AD TaxID=3035294 RepID=UPI0021DA1774|nr:hypothetical protein [Pseudomonas sp. RIT-PI-AD]
MKENHPNKVVDLKARLAKQKASANEQLYYKPPLDPDGVREMGDKEKVWWRNTLFFAERLVHNPAYGAARYDLARLENGQRLLHFVCELYEAFYPLDDSLMIDFSQSALLVRWDGDNDPGYPLVPPPPVLREE